MSNPLNWDGSPMPERISADYYGQNGAMGTYGLSGGVCGYLREDLAMHLPAAITDEMVEAVEREVGMSSFAWDMVDPKAIISAALKVAFAEDDGA